MACLPGRLKPDRSVQRVGAIAAWRRPHRRVEGHRRRLGAPVFRGRWCSHGMPAGGAGGQQYAAWVPAMNDDSADDRPAGGLFADSAASPRRRKRPPATPLQRALALLTRREHSRRELTRKLTAHGLDPSEVDTALDKLVAGGWLDDTRFAHSLVRARVNGGYGPLHIRAELATHGLDNAVISEALDSCDELADGHWTGVAHDLVRRRYGDSVRDDLGLRRKAANLLMRRGFPGDVIRAATCFEPDE